MVNKKTKCPIKKRNEAQKWKNRPGTHTRTVLLSFMRGKQVKNGRKTPENARKPSKMQKSSTTILSKSSCWFGLSDKTWTCGLYHPNWLIYLFLAVFAFSSPFCYAKTAFSYSRALLSPCTPVLFMVKNVVKSKYRMIVMWSCFGGGRSARKFLRRQRRNAQRSEKKYTNSHMWSASQKGMINMWSGRAENTYILLPQVLYCNSCEGLCQGHLKIKISTQNLIRSNQRKSSSRSFPSSSHNALVHTWWKWSHFAFRSINKPIITQKLICSKQRKGGYGINHI